MAINNNKFVPLIMQGVHMLGAEAKKLRTEAREEERYRSRKEAADEKQEERDRFGAILNYISGQSRNPNLAPESRTQLSEMGFKMLQQPDADLGAIDLQTVQPKPKEPGPLTYGIDPKQQKFYDIPEQGYDLGQVIDVAKAYQDDMRALREARSGGGRGAKEDGTPLGQLNALEKVARNRYNKGIAGLTFDTMGGERQVFRPIDEQAYQDYLAKIDALRKKYKAEQWTEQDQETLNNITTFDLYEKNVKGLNEAIEQGGIPQPMPSHKQDPFDLRRHVE